MRPKAVIFRSRDSVVSYDTQSKDFKAAQTLADDFRQQYRTSWAMGAYGPEFAFGWKDQVVLAPFLSRTQRRFSQELYGRQGKTLKLTTKKVEHINHVWHTYALG